MERRLRIAARLAVVLAAGAVLMPLLAGLPAASASTSAGFATAAPVLSVAEPPDAWNGWYRFAPLVIAEPNGVGRLLYRWDYGPGAWRPFAGAVVPKAGQHLLQVVRVSPDGESSDVALLWVKSDAFASPAAPNSAAPSEAAASVASTLGGTVQVGATVLPIAGPTVRRVGGKDRYEVALNVSREAFGHSKYVVVATGEKFPDALAASPLSGCLNAPILLTHAQALPSNFAAEIRRLGADHAIIVGGPGSVYPSVVTQLTGLGLSVERIGGEDRYACAANIGTRVLSYGANSGRVFVARGDLYPDALALGPLAYQGRTPIVLTLPTSLPQATQHFLQATKFTDGYLAGGPASITPPIARQIDGYVDNVTRIPGKDRYECAANVANAGISLGLASAHFVGMATGEKFADALTGGVGTGQLGGTIVLVRLNSVPLATGRFVAQRKFDIMRVDSFGGPASVSEAVLQAVRTLLK